MIRNFLILLATAFLVGCATTNSPHGYADPNEDVYGSAENFEYTQKSQAIAEMVDKLRTDPDFRGLYQIAKQRAEQRGHLRPTVIIREIEDNTRPGSVDSQATGQIRRELKAALRKTQLFAVIDLYERARMVDVTNAEANGGAAGDNLQSFGEYEAGDFVMFGEIAREDVGGHDFFHFLNLHMIDPVTGNVIWSDTAKFRKR